MSRVCASITGTGVVCPAGHTFADLARAVRSGVGCIGWITRIEPPEGAPVVACETADYDLSVVLGNKKSRLDPVQSHFLAACRYALQESELPLAEGVRDEVGISYGTAFGPTPSVEDYSRRLSTKGARYANPIIFNNAYVNAAPSLAAIEWGVRGPNHTVCAGWVSGLAALQDALLMLESGAACAVVAGGSEAISEMMYLGLAAEGYLSMAGSPQEALGTEGLVPGEGAGALVLESPAGAERRGASELGTILAAVARVGEDLVGAYATALECVLSDAAEPVLYLSPANGVSRLAAAEHEALHRAGLGSWSVHTVRLADTVGELFGAAAPVSVGVALQLLRPGETALIGALAPGYAGAAMVRRRGAV